MLIDLPSRPEFALSMHAALTKDANLVGPPGGSYSSPQLHRLRLARRLKPVHPKTYLLLLIARGLSQGVWSMLASKAAVLDTGQQTRRPLLVHRVIGIRGITIGIPSGEGIKCSPPLGPR